MPEPVDTHKSFIEDPQNFLRGLDEIELDLLARLGADYQHVLDADGTCSCGAYAEWNEQDVTTGEWHARHLATVTEALAR